MGSDTKWCIEQLISLFGIAVTVGALCAAIDAAIEARKSALEARKANALAQLNDRLSALDAMEYLLNNTVYSYPILSTEDQCEQLKQKLIENHVEALSLKRKRHLFPADRGWITDMILELRSHYNEHQQIIYSKALM